MAPQHRKYMQVDVFPSLTVPFSGNPLGVVVTSEGLSTEEMQKFASWTNLSETSFLLPPTDPTKADYKVRIFTVAKELPFAGHPTLGSCRVWLQSGGKPKQEGQVVQECGIGLVTIKSDPSSDRLSFASPSYIREGEVSSSDLQTMCDAMEIDPSEVLDGRWIDQGPGWAGLVLKSAEDVLAIKTKSITKAGSMKWGIIGAYPKAQAQVERALTGGRLDANDGQEDDWSPHFELRAFVPDETFIEDPVTGSLNAGFAKWFISAGMAPQIYVASQGACLGRQGRIYLSADQALAEGGEVWVGGETRICIEGNVLL